jgi:hypothetical protein
MVSQLRSRAAVIDEVNAVARGSFEKRKITTR